MVEQKVQEHWMVRDTQRVVTVSGYRPGAVPPGYKFEPPQHRGFLSSADGAPTKPPEELDGKKPRGTTINVYTFIDYGCDGNFDVGKDEPLPGNPVIVGLPDGPSRIGITDEHGGSEFGPLTVGNGDSLEVATDEVSVRPTRLGALGLEAVACGATEIKVGPDDLLESGSNVLFGYRLERASTSLEE